MTSVAFCASTVSLRWRFAADFAGRFLEAMSARPRICLNMIVKNEAAILERCLASVLPLIDCYVICDTGSSDTTVATIRAFFERHGRQGEVHTIDFVHFEHARNRALELCRAAPLDFDYILLTDADMELVLEDLDIKGRLGKPAYTVRQTQQISYDNVRLVRRAVPAHYVGVTHEYLHLDEPPTRLEGAWFIDHACGANRADKFERDIALLLAALEREPGNVRYMFYLAQSYRDGGQTRQALAWYERRIAAGGWAEEVWYAKYMVALCHKSLGDGGRFVQGCLDAYNFRPTRAEPLHALAQYYRLQGQHDACMLFCEPAWALPYPEHDTLFVDDRVYQVGLREEMSVSGFYSALEDRRHKGHAACMQLTTCRAAPEATRLLARSNTRYYVRAAAELFPGYRTQDLTLSVEAGYHPMNPSLCWHEGRVMGVVRTVNYTLETGVYHLPAGEKVYRTQNYLVELSADGAVVHSRKMLDRTRPRLHGPVRGLEDCRLFSWRGGLWASCTLRDRNARGRCEIALLEIDPDGQVKCARRNGAVAPELHQKNWMPLVRGDELLLLYSLDPTRVLRYDAAAGQPAPFQESVPRWALEHCRGGSQAIRIPGGWLALVHEVLEVEPGRRWYFHRFVRLDEELQVAGVSDPFYFLEKGVEFCAGLLHDARRRRLVASFGVQDRRACLAYFAEEAVLSLLT